MDGSTALAILDKKINSVESTIDTVTIGSDKKSIVITTVDGVSFSVSIPNAVDNPTLLNKFTVVNGELYYDGKRIAEYIEIPTTTSQLTNDSGFITSANLPNLTPYQAKNDSDLNTTNKTVVGAINELKTNVNNISVPTKTSQLTNDSGYITNSDIPTIPSKVSQLANDSNYVTQTEMTDAITNAVTGGTVDLTGYQKSSDNNLATTDKTVVGAINELKDNIDNFEGGGAGLTAEQSQKLETAYEHSQSTHVNAGDIPTKVSDLTNDSSFVTQTEMTNAINNAQLGGGSTEVDLSIYQKIQEDTLTTTAKTIPEAINELKSSVEGITVPTKVSELSNDSDFINKDVSNLTNYPTTTTVENTYAKKTDIPTIPTKVSQLNNDSGFITSIPEEYVTDTELNAKGYLTEHQDISGLQPKTDNTLTTNDKTVTGAINELKEAIDKGAGAEAPSPNIVTYSSLDQLSLANGTTTINILNALPDNSLLRMEIADNSVVTDIPESVKGVLIIDKNSSTGINIEYKVVGGELYIGLLTVGDTTTLSWKRLCSTKVADEKSGNIFFTNYLPSGVTVGASAYCKYAIKNGMCTLIVGIGINKTTATFDYAQIDLSKTSWSSNTGKTTLPPSFAGSTIFGLVSEVGDTNIQVMMEVNSSGLLYMKVAGGTTTTQGYWNGTISYVIKE